MVNLDKWEKVEHEDVKEGDFLKIHDISTGRSPAKTVEVYKGTVTLIDRFNAFHLDDGTIWDNEESPIEGETCTVYRRKPKSFKLPTKLGAIISGVLKTDSTGKRVFLVFDGGDWATTYNTHTPSTVEQRYTDLRIERKGIKVD